MTRWRRPRRADARRGGLARGQAGRDLRCRRRCSAIVQRRAPIYDKGQDGHYNLISALHKSVRGSDPDAALYYLARMFDAGEDPLYLGRRLVRMAVEDIGLADPQALVVANAAKDAYDYLGSPEGELAFAEACVYLATAPKSNAVYTAFKAATRAAKEHGSLLPPKHILNAPTRLMKDEGYGDGYRYDHDQPDAFSGQDYFPEKMGRQTFYDPPDRGFEREIRKRLEYWAKLRSEREKQACPRLWFGRPRTKPCHGAFPPPFLFLCIELKLSANLQIFCSAATESHPGAARWHCAWGQKTLSRRTAGRWSLPRFGKLIRNRIALRRVEK